MQSRSLFRIAISLTALTASIYACSNTDTGTSPGSGLPAGNSAGRRSANGGSSGGGGTDSGGGDSTAARGSGLGGSIMIEAGAQPDVKEELTEDAACGKGMADAKLLPVSIMLMFDRSGSMVSMQEPPTRWDMATDALKAFLQAPEADGLGVALRFFPHDEPMAGCTAHDCACDAEACAEVLVDMGALTAEDAPTDAQEQRLIDAIDDSAPDQVRGDACPGVEYGNTPIYPALSGALSWATTYQSENPDQKTVVVFVTDGDPAGGCTDDFIEIDQLAADALAMAGISTYVIGLAGENGEGLNQDSMNGLAQAGGTDTAFFVEDGPEAAAQLQETLDSIRGMELSCDFPMPEATDSGDEIDPELVNVTFTNDTGDPVTFTKVTDAGGCDTALSWYYDDEKAPTRIYLCPAACEAVTNQKSASIGVLVGCKPIVEPPH